VSTKRIPRLRTRVASDSDGDRGYLGCLYVDGDRVYAVGGSYHQPTFLVTDDGGHDWREVAHPPTPGLRSLFRHGHALYLTGEYGMLAVSVDSGLTWTQLPVETPTCLFDLARAPDGTWWIAGDDDVILRSTDGITYQQVPETASGRSLGIRIVDGVVHVLGYDGHLRVWNGSAFEARVVEADTPLTDLLVTRAGTWLLSGDGGMVFRSLDRGATWSAVPLDTANDLEAMIETPRGILIVGDETVLFSDDDGQTFVEVETELDGHLWSIVAYGDGYLVGGDEGAIWTLEVSATETVEVELVEPSSDDDEAEVEEDEEDEGIVPARFDTIEQASARWIKEGTAFSDGINEYVRKVYAVGPNKAGHEPSETRRDMADYVREQLVALNASGDHRRARALFPPAYEPFDYDALGQSISRLAYLRDGRRLAQIAGEVFELGRDRITPITDVMGFAQSFDRRWVAKEYADRIDIHDGWDGNRVRSLPCEIADIVQATVAPDGDAVLIAADNGIYWLTEHGAQRLLPDHEVDSVSYPHAALSPNGRFVAMGTQDSSHIVVDRKTGRRHMFDPMSSYPHFAAFHHDRPEALLNSCHALYGSGTMVVDLDAMVAGKSSVFRPLDQRAWVYGIATTSTGYVLADRSGYLWAFDFAGEQQWYCFLGSTLTALDISQDRKTLLVGSFAGIICELSLSETKPDPRLLTNGPVKDQQRWLFWQGHPPLIW
jgi:photosystem II stability/assembly factor-like uncharacterized protein